MLASLEQTGRHHLALNADGHLALTNDQGSTWIVDLRGRKVERLAISLPEFGAFHSREVVARMLQLFSGANLSSDTLEKAQLEDANTVCRKLGVNFQRAIQMGFSNPERFLNCWFLGLEALCTLLENVRDSESFWRELRRTRHISTGSLNWHYEYSAARSRSPELAQALEIPDKTIVVAPPKRA